MLPPTARPIVTRIAAERGLTEDQIVNGKYARRSVGAARRQAMAEVYDARRPNGRRRFTLGQVARMFGCSDHTSARHAVVRHHREAVQ